MREHSMTMQDRLDRLIHHLVGMQVHAHIPLPTSWCDMAGRSQQLMPGWDTGHIYTGSAATPYAQLECAPALGISAYGCQHLICDSP